MKAFLWHNIKKVSDRYHKDGSVLIVANTIERARELGEQECNGMTIEIDPTAIFISEDGSEKVFVFPDAGCC